MSDADDIKVTLLKKRQGRPKRQKNLMLKKKGEQEIMSYECTK